MTEKNSKKQSWWATLPGIITGTATLITAIVALLTILQQTGFFDSPEPIPPSNSIVTIDFLKGTWKNEWTMNGMTSSETVKITEDGRYYANGVYSFLIHNFEYDKSRNQIKFMKTSIVDPRDLLNTLTVENLNLLVGTEADYVVKYTKLSN
jgi:hypothetical protein